jgi:lipopolysaccharide/colanic/teichoic acid biosynthesis glycosyltransferase
MWKLRTMVPDAEARLADLIRRDERAAVEWAAYGRLAGDPRIAGPFGHWARKLSIDELPQLLNVVAGQMRLVGPRPILLSQAKELPEWQLRTRQSVAPGVTGLWQVCGRSETTLRQMVRLDLLYVRRRGHCTDLCILLRTPAAVLCSRGAY